MTAAPALLQGRSTALYHIEPERLRIVGRDTADGPEHGLWDDHALLPPYEEYVQSAMAFGIMEPVIATVVDGVAFVVDGRRRVVAAREANKRLAAKGEPSITVPVVAKDGRRVSNDTYAVVLVMLNEIRRSDSAVMRMRKAARLVERGVALKLIAVAFGVSVPCVSDWVTTASACEEVQQALGEERLPLVAALHIARLPPARQPEALSALLARDAPTAAAAAAIARGIVRARPATMKPSVGRIRMVLAYDDKLPADFLKGVRFALGELDADAEVPGLAEILALPVPPYARGGTRKRPVST